MNSIRKWGRSRGRLPALVTLGTDMDRLFDDLLHGMATWPRDEASCGYSPAVEVAEQDESFQVRAELPGLAEADVKVTVEDGALILEGEKKASATEGDKRWHRTERRFGSFKRVFTLPDTIDKGGISAEFANGVLEVTLPKVEEAKAATREIDIKAG